MQIIYTLTVITEQDMMFLALCYQNIALVAELLRATIVVSMAAMDFNDSPFYFIYVKIYFQIYI
jgi:hypothetical protein